MVDWTTEIKKDPHTRYFYINWILYGVMLVATTIYCYGRLDYVRSYRAPPPSTIKATTPVEIKTPQTENKAK